ncbi:UNVERIFIED_CONTAM: putative mitochondrial protein [Sesamum latifolium]|uniref:Mitochondrial protein n=1 Tax=Sesamum latifolium TaxID=2727402 RepID=A0AAW2X5L9_9LAMI
MPTFVMSCFLIPSSICNEIEGLMVDFFWHNKGVRNIHWIAWDKLCARKEEGGLEFRKMGAFNLALLAKQVWRIISNPNSLLSRLLKHKYFPSSDIFTVQPIQGSSFTWRSILEARSVILRGSRWQQEDADLILNLTLNNGHSDSLRWHYEKHGQYSVRSLTRSWLHLVLLIRFPARLVRSCLNGISFGERQSLLKSGYLPGRFAEMSYQLSPVYYKWESKQNAIVLGAG